MYLSLHQKANKLKVRSLHTLLSAVSTIGGQSWFSILFPEQHQWKVLRQIGLCDLSWNASLNNQPVARPSTASLSCNYSLIARMQNEDVLVHSFYILFSTLEFYLAEETNQRGKLTAFWCSLKLHKLRLVKRGGLSAEKQGERITGSENQRGHQLL